jgi:hypothetical protein
LTPFSLCSRQHPVPLSDTGIDPVHYTYTYILFHTVRGCMYITPYTMRGIWINIYVYKMFNINQYILYFFILSVGVFWNVQHREGACVGRYDHEIMTKISYEKLRISRLTSPCQFTVQEDHGRTLISDC